MSSSPLSASTHVWVDPARVHHEFVTHHANTIWLDAGPEASEGFSYIAFIDEDLLTDDAYDQMRAEIIPARACAHPLVGAFRLGWVGWFGYEFGAAQVGAAFSASRYPDTCFGRVRAVVAFNHETHTVAVVAENSALLAELERLVVSAESATDFVREASASSGEAIWRHKPDEYREMVRACTHAIANGDVFQLCLTNEVRVAGEFDPLQVYGRLRADSPSHHGALLRLNGVNVLSSTPEVFLRVEGSGRIVTMPIKGTRPRGTDKNSDEILARELRDSAKEQAENLMIVDLMRNDLSRVCQLGTVTAEHLLEVHSLAQVHQLVSTVSGQLREGATMLDAVAVAFPAGSMTGAPKIAAINILNALEQGPRGIYSGAFGWIGSDGTGELAMVIRSIVIDETGASLGTGGGVTIDSDPESELNETYVKVAAGLRALGLH